MSTSLADIRAVLEAEAPPNPHSLPGTIDPAARKLFDKARSAGWQSLTIGEPSGVSRRGSPPLTITFDGTGRYAYERTLPLGLKERVVCDGKTLLHLYPDLGIGARRNCQPIPSLGVRPPHSLGGAARRGFGPRCRPQGCRRADGCPDPARSGIGQGRGWQTALLRRIAFCVRGERPARRAANRRDAVQESAAS